MDISDKELLHKQIFKNKKLENEIQDLKDKLTAERMRNKSELQMNLDLKRIIKTLELKVGSLNQIVDQYADKIVQHRNEIDKFLDNQ
jgi:hypothetical protein